MMDGRVFVIACCVATVAWCAARTIVHQPKRLGPRIAPYVTGARSRLGTIRPQRPTDTPAAQSGAAAVFGPMIRSAARTLSRVVDATNADGVELRLDQAGMPADIDRYRTRQLGYAAAGLATGATLGLLIRSSAPTVILLAALGGVWGATRWRARIDAAIRHRRERMRSELYTVCQLLAIYLRTGDTPAGAVDRITERAHGDTITELRAAARTIRTGTPPADTFQRLCTTTPEPTAARLYRVLASSWINGGDPDALLALAEDVRASRREDLQRQMTKRQTAMALPLVLVIGPILILFVAAAIPHIVFGR